MTSFQDAPDKAMMIIFAKFPSQTNLLIPSSKFLLNASNDLFWCPYII